MRIPSRKLHIVPDHRIEVVNLRVPAGTADDIIDGTHFFPAWHMNKKTWYTLLLDGSLPASALVQRLAASRERALR